MPLFPRYDGPPLIDRICAVDNLTLAWRRVRSNIQVARRKYSAGPDAVTLRDFQADWAQQMSRLAEELREGSYRPLPPRRVTIPKSSGGERAIAILAVRDRIAQRAVQQVLEPLFDPLFLDCSYGCRPGIGVPEAVARVARYAEQGLAWVVDADVASYFDSIDQRILLGLLRQRIDEVAVLRLVGQWLAAGALATGETAPLSPPAATSLLARGGQAARRVLAWGAEQAAPAPPLPLPLDPYAAARWDLDASEASIGGLSPANQLGTALLLARPVLSTARAALPYVRRLGGRRLALAGAAAVGVVAAGEWALRQAEGAGRGTPQGGSLSPLLANIYLHPFDLAITSQGLRLVRFMDDFVIMCASQSEATRALDLARRQIAMFRLSLNEQKTRIVSYAEGLEFLGQALAPRASGPRLAEGLASFAEAEQALRAAANQVRGKIKR